MEYIFEVHLFHFFQSVMLSDTYWKMCAFINIFMDHFKSFIANRNSLFLELLLISNILLFTV